MYYKIPRQYTPQEAEKMETAVPQVVGLAPQSAVENLAQNGLTGKVQGDGSKIVEQFPEPGTTLPRGSTLLLYTENAQMRSTQVPSLTGQNAQQVQKVLAGAGLNLRAYGAPEQSNTVALFQNLQPGCNVPMGSAVEVYFYDPDVPDE